ncbi:hypothetical protein [Dyadobacter sp. CY343]|uniref:hypothetical protein n=1 Tax=Dyadobacter sp. CY343 TaxID=2907299 RepID=UPI001F3D08CB|nr:hypothetical protein [Dyadobacter sp. CY343]MCE7060864.1 hypothetical protein [Dyadobacter sp. CY343]
MSAVRFSVHKKFHLLQSRTSIWEASPEELRHYRLIFILSGNGQFVLDGKIAAYAKSGLILLKPDQQPVFQEDRGTEIFVIAFHTFLADDFQKKKAFDPDFADTYKQAENLCNNTRLTQGKPLPNERDGQTIAYLINQIAFEISQKQSSHVKLIKGSIDLIMTILARNNFETKRTEEKSSQQVLTERMVEYLKGELQQNKTVRIPELLLHFNTSEEVANLCMMNSTGMSLRNFIIKYKADLFKSRMLKVDVGEISSFVKNHLTT